MWAARLFAAGFRAFHRAFTPPPSCRGAVDLPEDLQINIYKRLEPQEAAILNLALPSRVNRALVAKSAVQTCNELFAVLQRIVNLEPRLSQAFPQLPDFLQLKKEALANPVFSTDFYLLTKIQAALRDSLRMIATNWAYDHPVELRDILFSLGFVLNDHPECESRFEREDARWPSGPIIPHLFDRAIIASNLNAICLLVRFVPPSKQNTCVLSEMSSRKKNCANLHLSIMCLFNKYVWSYAEFSRFQSRFGTSAAKALRDISKAFDCDRVEGLQNEQTNRQIWELMHGSLTPEKVEQSASTCCLRLLDKVARTYIPPDPCALPIQDLINSANALHLPFTLLGRCIKNSNAGALIGQADMHSWALDLSERHFAGGRRRSSADVGGDLLSGNLISKWLPRAADELARYRPLDDGSDSSYHLSAHLLDALYLSLFGFSSGKLELREAVKHFLYCSGKLPSGTARFPDATLSKLFDPLCRSDDTLANYGAHLASSTDFMRDVLSYQWLLTSIVSKLLQRCILLVSNAEIEQSEERDAEDAHIAHCLSTEICKYDLQDIQIDFAARQQRSSWSVSAYFFSDTFEVSSPHVVVAKYSWKKLQQYFTPYDHAAVSDVP